MRKPIRMRVKSISMTFIITLILFTTNLQAQDLEPHFKDYQVIEKHVGKNAPLVLPRNARMFRTRLKEAAKQKPNFAGHYILTTWGCGMECLMGALIDAKTGKIYQMPFTICCWGADVDDDFEPIQFRTDSNLIIFSGARDEKEGDNGKHFYKFDRHRFVPITSIFRSAQ